MVDSDGNKFWKSPKKPPKILEPSLQNEWQALFFKASFLILQRIIPELSMVLEFSSTENSSQYLSLLENLRSEISDKPESALPKS